MQEKEWSDRSLLAKAFAYTLAVGLVIFTIVCPDPIWPRQDADEEPYH